MLSPSRPAPGKGAPGGGNPSGYFSEETIAAIITGVGGSLGVVRVSGPRAFEALQWLGGPTDSEPRKLARAALLVPSDVPSDDPARGPRPLDSALIVRFVAPQSFTGEDVVEFHLHGGGFLPLRLMEILGHYGIRRALPGEFSFRAVRNGKMTLSEAQAVADLIGSSNDRAAALALEKLSGTQSKLVQTLAVSLRRMAVLGEVGIDFADQDVDEVSLPTLKRQLAPIIQTLEALRTSYERGRRIQDGVGVAFIGLPNAGKSSFFNALLGEDRSIVSDIAGTTRDVVREHLSLRGRSGSITLRLEDTAGLRHLPGAQDAVERLGIARSQKAAREADLVLLLVDPSSPDSALLEHWQEIGTPSKKTIGILTKKDLGEAVAGPRLENLRSALDIREWIETSALTGAGIDEAVDAIVEFCERWVRRDLGEVLLTRLDHLRAVVAALDALARALSAAEIDLFASDIRQALFALGPLIGETLADDILTQIFSDFCIGK